jgi:class 3 adenylate cyclase
VLFADLVDFARRSQRSSPAQVVATLNELFSSFDALAQRHGLEKIKTIGDAYMVAGGCPTRDPTTPRRSPRWRWPCRPR